MTNQTSDVKVTRNYEGGIIALVAILLIVVVGGGIYLVSIDVGAAPIVSTIFGMMFAMYSEIESLSAQYVEVSSALAKAMEEGDAWRDMFPLSTPAEIGAIVAAYRDEHPITPATTRRACKSG